MCWHYQMILSISIISEPESKIGNTTNEPDTHQPITNPNGHDPKVWSGCWWWSGLTRLQRSDMADSNTTTVVPTSLHANITNNNRKSVATTEETYAYASDIILVTKHESWMINETTVLNSIGLDGTTMTRSDQTL
ncbi:Riboflavin synthase alpha chain [Candidatus Hodgkinia cicadicola]|uniref:Riboflavin synthase alpha chain n=1 Tax=Candidatus Hodgkinia cicadicola TaxID=573658 RepID=A0ABX4MEL3_9HYPH|nr:Riboflavin synthase alpha chain [Candidatus Hodgkinia cicadicola]